ncbi:MAG: alpha/beta hydrolase [Sphingomonadaceae bacterium]|nr:alpha/beta hydrolase [Sphingomonadaceae bacterium]
MSLPRITRHVVEVGACRVHYRRCGRGPALLLVHQSPRSSAEYEPLMLRWGREFTVIAPDSPGFGQSTPFADDSATIDDFAQAVIDFADSIGLGRVPAYGFHSGAIILMRALRLQPHRFAAVAAGGYAVWTEEERRIFSEHYLPPFRPSAYGEHLVWAWNRILEQSWFFPWFDPRPGTRLPKPFDDPARVHAQVMELMDSGDAYRAGYGAVLKAERDVPPPDADIAPVFINTYAADPLCAHIDRLGELPRGWSTAKLDTPAEHEAASYDWLRPFAAGDTPPVVETTDEGWAPVSAEGFDGLIHWRIDRGESVACIAAPGRAVDMLPAGGIDPPGHGLSDAWAALPPTRWRLWRGVLDAAAKQIGLAALDQLEPPPGDPARLFPDLSPDRFGTHLIRAWSIVRAERLFAPWHDVGAETALLFAPADLAPDRLHIAARALLKAGPAARAFAEALNEGDR